jgi:hypothetical protein
VGEFFGGRIIFHRVVTLLREISNRRRTR